MLTIYHTPGTRAYRVIWTCEELGVPYTIVPVDFSADYRASDEWRRMNPVGKVPAMTDGPLTMFESGAMVQYVLDRYGEGRLQPARGTPEHALFLQWLWFAEATFSRPLGEIVNHRRAFPGRESAEAIEEMRDRARLCTAALEQALAGRTWLVGEELTAADLMMGYSVHLFTKLTPDSLPEQVSAYWDRLRARPSYAATEAADQSAKL